MNVPLFEGVKATRYLRALWADKGALQPILTGPDLLDADGKATPYLRALWAKAFPLRGPLPVDPLANADGTGTVRFWNLFR